MTTQTTPKRRRHPLLMILLVLFVLIVLASLWGLVGPEGHGGGKGPVTNGSVVLTR